MDRRVSADFSAWHKDIAAHGFLDFWRRNLPQIADAHASGEGDFLGKELAALVASDPDLAPYADAAGREAAESAIADDGTDGTHAGFVAKMQLALRSASDSLPGVVEADGQPVRLMIGKEFRNWGRTVKNVPAVTAIPKTKVGVCNLVKWAAANDKRVRVSGYRHTWGNLYGADGGVLISLLPLDVVEDLPATEPPIDPSDQLQGIAVVGTVVENGVEKALCRIGAGTTNEQFRRWCLDAKGGALQWTVPLNVIMVEITWGGSNGPICHGAGLRNQTLSDLVAEIEFVNPKGELQTVSDPEDLRSASGAFGLMGVVTSITLKLDRMTYARLEPVKTRVALTIPPPDGFVVPAEVDMSGVDAAALEAARQDFITRATESYYAEWFWFTLEPDCWVNTWHNDGDAADSRDYPGDLASWFQAKEEYLAQLLTQSTVFNWLPETLQAQMLAKGAMTLLPADEVIVTPLIDGLHFRRGIQNMRVFDMEWEIPIPALPDDSTKPDWSICQRAWWEAIAEVYKWKARDKAPMRLTLEMRIMGGSGVTLAPQHGNDFGTCSIEVLTTINTDRTDWAAFMQDVTDRWVAITDGQGGTLNHRPHWAKEWQGLSVEGQPIADYLRETAYSDRIPTFGQALGRIAAAGGYSMQDLEERFSNESLTGILGAIYD